THALIQRALYDDITPLERAQLHDRIAHVLESDDTSASLTVTAELAYHCAAAVPVGSLARAVDFAHRAGLNAGGALAYEQAVLHLEHALHFLESVTPPDPRRTLQILLDLGDAQRLASRTDEAAACFRRAFALAQREGDGEAMARAALGQGEVSFV